MSIGWDLAEFRCGRCSYTGAATSSEEFRELIENHRGDCPGLDAPAILQGPNTVSFVTVQETTGEQ